MILLIKSETNKIYFYFTAYLFEWNGKWVRVVRPDVLCTNGVIHVIDTVLLRDFDMSVTAPSSASSLFIYLPHILTILLVRWLL